MFHSYFATKDSELKIDKIISSVSETQNTLFDNFGKITESKQITDDNSYTSSYQYNLSGALMQETYPSGRVAKQSNPFRGFTGQTCAPANGTQDIFWTGTTYDVAG